MRKRDGGKRGNEKKGRRKILTFEKRGRTLLIVILFISCFILQGPSPFLKSENFPPSLFLISSFSSVPFSHFLVFLRPPFSRRRFFSVIILKFKGLVVYGYCEGYRFGFCFYNCYKYG